LKRCVESIQRQTRLRAKIYVTDAGSTDGTLEYLQAIASQEVVPIFVGKKLGQAKAYNDVFAIVETPYVCWLSDDNEVVDHGLDRAVAILQADSAIGMVALKTMDRQGPFVGTPFIGGISEAGILNVNQGVLPTSVLKKMGGFSEEFRDYGIDPALTADVLFAGYKIVYTRKVALHHYRNWSEDPNSESYQWLRQRHDAARKLYQERYCAPTASRRNNGYLLKAKVAKAAKKVVLRLGSSERLRRSAAARTGLIVLTARYISIMDPLMTWGKDYHLVQVIPAPRKITASGSSLT
jgi:GT2 family glycosyltransferase